MKKFKVINVSVCRGEVDINTWSELEFDTVLDNADIVSIAEGIAAEQNGEFYDTDIDSIAYPDANSAMIANGDEGVIVVVDQSHVWFAEDFDAYTTWDGEKWERWVDFVHCV